MIASLWLLASAWLGIGLARFLLADVLRPLVRWAVGTTLGWVLACWLAFGVASWRGRIEVSWLVGQTVFLALAAAGMAWWGRRQAPRDVLPLLSRNDWWLLGLCALLSPLLIIEFYGHWLGAYPDGLYSSGSTTIDIGWHGAVAASFLFGQNFPPMYPLLPGYALTYYFMADFHLAVLLGLGMTFPMAATVTGVVLVLVVVVLIHELAIRITRSRPSAWLAVLLFLLNGGMGFVYFFEQWWASQKPLRFFLPWLPGTYAGIWDDHVAFINVIADGFLPQRPLAYGFAMAFSVILIAAHLWQASTEDGPPAESAVWRWLAVAGTITGLLPMWHTFSWLAIMGVSALWCLARPRPAWIGFFAPAVLMALPQLQYLLSNSHVSAALGDGGAYLLPGWLSYKDPDYTLFWVRNVGLPFVFAIPAWLTLSASWRAFLLPFAGLWAFATTVMLSPEPYNNIKLMQFWQLANLIAVADWIRRLAEPPVRQRWLAIVIIVGCVASGSLEVVRETQYPVTVFNPVHLKAAAFIRQHTSPKAVFLTAPIFNNTPAVLAGRPIVNSYPLFAWSHGLSKAQNPSLVDARKIYRNDWNAKALIAKYRIDYLFLGPEEQQAYQPDRRQLATVYPVVYARNGVTIYQARPGASLAPATEPDETESPAW
jgi:hypothetical protein